MLRLGDVIHRVQGSTRIPSLSLEARTGEDKLRYWQAEGKRRIESDRDGVVTISHGALTWKYGPETGWENDPLAASAFFPTDRIQEAKALLSEELQVVGEEQLAGRAAVKLLAKSRPGMMHLDTRLWRFAESGSYLWLDSERCVILKSSKLEVLRIAFDEPLSDELFDPPGVILDPPIPIEHHFPHAVSVEEARARADFTLLAPTLLPERSRLVTWMAADHPKSPGVGALYALEPGAYHTLTLHLWQGQDDPLPDQQWDSVDVHGVRVERRQAGPRELTLARAMIMREGIRAMVISDLPMDLVSEVAASIEPI